MLRFAIGLLLLLSLSSPIAAQAARPALQEAKQGNWVIRAVSINDSVGPARIQSIGRDVVIIGDSEVPIASILRIDREVRAGGSGMNGALLGGGMLGLLGLSFAQAFCQHDCSVFDYAGGAAIGATVGFTVGGMIGGLTNPRTRSWVQLWPVP